MTGSEAPSRLGLTRPLATAAYESLRPPVQLADPVPRLEVGEALASLQLPVLLRLHAEMPGCATDAETFALPIELHHRRERGQGRGTTGAQDVAKKPAA